MSYVSFDPNAQVIGQAMLGFKAAIRKDVIEPLLVMHGLTSIQADQWYPLQKWLDVLNDIDKSEDAWSNMLTFVNIGVKVAENVYFPPEVEAYGKEKGFVEFLCKFGAPAYYRDHRGNVGELVNEKVNDKHLKFIADNPYPPDFWYRNMYGGAKRFGGGSSFVVHYEDLSMREAKPGELVIIHVVIE